MFNDQDLSVGGWIIFWILMAIPLVNVIVFIIILFSGDANKTLKHMLWAEVILVLIVVGLFMTLLAPLWGPIWDALRDSLPF